VFENAANELDKLIEAEAFSFQAKCAIDETIEIEHVFDIGLESLQLGHHERAVVHSFQHVLSNELLWIYLRRLAVHYLLEEENNISDRREHLMADDSVYVLCLLAYLLLLLVSHFH